MLWLLLWIPLCAWFLLPKLGLLPTLLLLDRLVPSFELLRRNAVAFWRNAPIAAALDRPGRLTAYDRYSLFLLITLVYWLALMALWRGTDFTAELILCSFALPQMQSVLADLAERVLQMRDKRMRRIAAKCVVRAIKALSLALMRRPAVVHSADVLPHIDRAPELVWQVFKHGSMTAMLLYIKRYSQRSYYTAYKYFYYYQTEQLSWKQRPSAQQARRQLVKMLDEQQWAEFASAKAFGLAVILFHQGEPEIPQWIAQLNFALARFLAVLTLSQGLHSWRNELTPLGPLFALVLVQRSELSEYWKIVCAVLLSSALGYLGFSMWFCAALATLRPFWFGRSLFKFALKRLAFALTCQVPAFWLLAVALELHRHWWQLLLYSPFLGWPSTVGMAGLLMCGLFSHFEMVHLLCCAGVTSTFYVLVAYNQRPEPLAKPKTTVLQRYQVIENYKAT